MSEKILVAYATRTGRTARVAEVVEEVLTEQGAAADVRDVREVDDLKPYRALVLGSAIRAGNLMPEVLTFAKENKEALDAIPFAAFVVCATMQESTEENRQEVASYLAPLREIREPHANGMFSGAIDRSKLSLPLRLMLKAMKVEGGDWTDWDAVRTWARQLVPVLQTSASGGASPDEAGMTV